MMGFDEIGRIRDGKHGGRQTPRNSIAGVIPAPNTLLCRRGLPVEFNSTACPYHYAAQYATASRQNFVIIGFARGHVAIHQTP
jgi:hypothetical protein